MNATLFLIPLLVGFVLLVIWILQLLWNSTFPDLFGWKAISFWTSFKLLLIAAILFGGAMKIPFGYGMSATNTDANGGTTTTHWSIGSLNK